MLKFFDYWKVNQYNGLRKPSEIHANDNMLNGMISRYLLQRVMSVYKWELPKSINQRYFEYTLFLHGFLAVFNHPKFGVIAQRCAFSNYDLYYQPKDITVSNGKFFKIPVKRTLGVDSVLFTLEEDFCGCGDILSFYSGLLSELWLSLMMNTKNSHFAYLFGCEGKNQADTMKSIFDDVASGKVAVFYDKNLRDKMTGQLNFELFNNNLKGNYIVNDILMSIREVLNLFDSEFGIPNANTAKRERLVTDEVNQNNIETYTRSEMWLNRLQDCCEQVNEMFAGQLLSPMSVDFRYPTNTADTNNESEVNTDNGID